jgi:phage tail sheath protein FI
MATSTLNRTTPGVYITEYNAFPQSVVGVNTAVPAFIGYTQTAVVDGKDVTLKPIQLTSMADYIQVFGTEFNTSWEISTTPPAAGGSPDFMVDGQGYYVSPAPNQPQFNLYYSMQLFFANGGATCYVVSVGGYIKKDGTPNSVNKDDLVQGLDAIYNQNGPTMLVIPEAVYLSSIDDFYTVTGDMLTQSYTLQDRVAIYDVYGANTVPQMPTVDLNSALTSTDGVISQFQANPAFQTAQTTTLNGLSYGMAYFPFLNTTAVDPSDINYTNFDPTDYAPSGTVLPDASPLHSTPTMLEEVLTLFNNEQYPDTPGSPVIPNAKRPQVQQIIDSINQADPHGSPTVSYQNNLLASSLTKYAKLLSVVAAKAGLLPPSSAMAGVYTLNDNNRGVWNAPANMSLQSTTSVTVNLNNDQQGGLNVPINGMAIDVIRDFPGRGSVVWGARTLDGNSQDWRYIQVRRTINYVEQSIKAAINPYVFAPNVSATWVAVVQMISGFLQGLWSQGGLMGDKASDAFTVLCGVPATMTATDILNGYMVVQVTLQMVHPAEFIELEFRQTMQGA